MKVYLVMYHDYSTKSTEYVAVCTSLAAAKAKADEELWMRTKTDTALDICRILSPDEHGTLWVRDTTPYKILELDYIDA